MIIQDASTNKHVINDALSPLGDIDKLWVKELAEYARNISFICKIRMFRMFVETFLLFQL